MDKGDTVSPSHMGNRGKERDLFGAHRLILTEGVLTLKLPEFICVLQLQDCPSFLILDFFLPETSVLVQVVYQKLDFILLCLINMLAILSSDKTVQLPCQSKLQC